MPEETEEWETETGTPEAEAEERPGLKGMADTAVREVIQPAQALAEDAEQEEASQLKGKARLPTSEAPEARDLPDRPEAPEATEAREVQAVTAPAEAARTMATAPQALAESAGTAQNGIQLTEPEEEAEVGQILIMAPPEGHMEEEVEGERLTEEQEAKE